MIFWDESTVVQNVLRVLLITFNNSRHVLYVLSKPVGNALETFSYAQATRNFIYLGDTFCDCLNLTSKLVGQMKRKDALKPYYDENDWMFWVRTFITIFTTFSEMFSSRCNNYTIHQLPRNSHFFSSFLINQIEVIW